MVAGRDLNVVENQILEGRVSPEAENRRRQRHRAQLAQETEDSGHTSLLTSYFRLSLIMAYFAIITSDRPLDASKLMPITEPLKEGFRFVIQNSVPFTFMNSQSLSAEKEKLKEASVSLSEDNYWNDFLGMLRIEARQTAAKQQNKIEKNDSRKLKSVDNRSLYTRALEFSEIVARSAVDSIAQFFDPVLAEAINELSLGVQEFFWSYIEVKDVTKEVNESATKNYCPNTRLSTNASVPTFLKKFKTTEPVEISNIEDCSAHGENSIPKSAWRTLFEKILTSSARLLTIVNLALCLTFLVHSYVAYFFLGRHLEHTSRPRRGLAGSADLHCTPVYAIRLVGGYILFKLMLITSVLSPLHAVDVLILLSWYTGLCFLRSLAYMAHVSLNRLISVASMQQQDGGNELESDAQGFISKQKNGILQLLLLTLVCTIASGVGCVFFFYKAGLPTVTLLGMDAIILTIDISRYLFTYVQGIIVETYYRDRISQLEERQLDQSDIGHASSQHQIHNPTNHVDHRDSSRTTEGIESEQFEREIELTEREHRLYANLFQSFSYGFEIVSSLVTACHFIHIWHWHGLRFGLVDSVLLLHLHSALSTIRTKIIERRKVSQLANTIDTLFENATEKEISKAHACGDLCCICLGTMLGSNVKKLKCNHMYHSHCLHKVVERARSLEAAKCPLCRASMIAPKKAEQMNRSVSHNTAGNDGNETAGVDVLHEVALQAAVQQGLDDTAIFRFSTEGFMPSWLPIPSFSFEVVRRQQTAPTAFATANNHEAELAEGQRPETITQDTSENEVGVLQRLFGFAFGPPLTPEEEEAAVVQLQEMFPQYERDDLVRELRRRGSIEQVAESILLGFFSGIPRND